MKETRLLFVALAATGLAGAWGAYRHVPPAVAAPNAEVRTVVLVVSPEDAAVAVDGHPRQHQNGIIEIRGPLGSVFTVEAVANGASTVERVAVTELGALPARIAVPAPARPLPVAAEEPPPKRKPSTLGALTVVCTPKCDRVVVSGTDLGPGHVLNRAMPAGRYTLDLSAPNGSKKTLAVEVAPDQTKEVRVAMDGRPADPYALLTPPAAPEPPPTDPGFLTIAAYPWATVSEGGRPLCVTPCLKVALPPGTHLLGLENDEAAIKHSITVTIRSGELTTKHIAFR